MSNFSANAQINYSCDVKEYSELAGKKMPWRDAPRKIAVLDNKNQLIIGSDTFELTASKASDRWRSFSIHKKGLHVWLHEEKIHDTTLNAPYLIIQDMSQGTTTYTYWQCKK
jgi:hypothetical protein